ncbi:hypothetical protein QIA36_06915 (plasmid) [Borreliella yangtzensis]
MGLIDDKNIMKEILHTKIYIQKYNIMYHKNKEYSSEKERNKYPSLVL